MAISAGFNGAMPFQAWILVVIQNQREHENLLQWGHALSGMDTGLTKWPSGNSQGASMGPCPFRHGYHGRSVSGYQGWHCFNGAMPFQAWIPIPQLIWARVLCASMGPCPFRHGYRNARRCATWCDPASMGPCPFRHGYAAHGTETTAGTPASMGPCPFRHGYNSNWFRLFYTVIASMGPCPFRHGYIVNLARRHIDPVASMGPCPFRHGYVSDGKSRLDNLGELQWGHALSGMDTPHSPATAACTRKLQWGHALSGMDTQKPSKTWRENTKLQWGHALSGMDTASATACAMSSVSCFNGAMPFQAWILLAPRLDRPLRSTLQWGHALSGMDTPHEPPTAVL